MRHLECERAREMIPDFVAGRLENLRAGRVEAHVEACHPCARELELVSSLHRERPAAPPGLARRIKAELAELVGPGESLAPPTERGAGASTILFPWWGLAAAAVAAIALGIGVQVQAPAPAEPSVEVPAFAMEGAADDLWLSDDGEIAGAPTLEGLTEEALLRFLEELDAGGVA